MPNRVNIAIREEYDGLFTEDLDALFVQPLGLSVMEANDLRGKLGAADLRMQVLRSRLARQVLEARGYSGLDEIFEGVAAVIVPSNGGGDGAAIAAAKVVADWKKEAGRDLPEVKGGVLEGAVLDPAAAAALAKLPGRVEVMATLAAQIQGPGRRVAGAVNAPGAGVAGAVSAHADKLKEAGG